MKILKAVLICCSLFCSVSNSQTNSLLPDSSSEYRSLKFDLRKNALNKSFRLKTINLPETQFDPLQKKINYPLLYGMGALYLGAGIGVHINMSNAWWKDNRTSFHFQNDWSYALWFDKIGHFFDATILVHIFSVGFEAANFQTEDAMIYGTISALAFLYYVEIEDGFGAQWGFSPGDAISDALGAGYALAQYYFPYLQNFQFKFSYYPSAEMRSGKHIGNFFDDYEGQKHWLTFRMKNLLPGDLAEIWPAFLNLAVGMGVKNLDGSGGGRREIFIGLDFNVLELPLEGGVGNFIKNTLNYFHLPMPGIRISPDYAFFVFLF